MFLNNFTAILDQTSPQALYNDHCTMCIVNSANHLMSKLMNNQDDLSVQTYLFSACSFLTVLFYALFIRTGTLFGLLERREEMSLRSPLVFGTVEIFRIDVYLLLY